MKEKPQLLDFIYVANTVPEAINLYVDALRCEGSLASIQHAKALELFRDKYVMDREFLSYMRDNVFNNLYNEIDKNEPDVRFLIEGRRKALIKTEEKILLYLNEYRSLDLIRDMMAFRIIIFGDDSIDLIRKAYSVMELCIEFCIRHGCTICDADPISHDAFKSEKAPNNIIVPKYFLMNPQFENSIKDYIRFPKENGYQSIHAIFRMDDGKTFELQVRTMDMHIRAESGPASHLVYDSIKYTNRVNFNPTLVSMDGFNYNDDMLLDYVGLWKSAQVILRRKSF